MEQKVRMGRNAEAHFESMVVIGGLRVAGFAGEFLEDRLGVVYCGTA